MKTSTRSHIKPIIRNVALALGFGGLSLLFGQVQFKIPGVDGVISGLNEIPSLVSVFYLTNPLYLIVVSAISSLGTPGEGSALSTFTFHICGLVPFWFFYKYFLSRAEMKVVAVAFRTALGVILYYLAFIIPIMILTNILFGIHDGAFFGLYGRVLQSASFEITTTTIIVTLFLLHLNAQNRLKDHLQVLEERVQERTAELDLTIRKLHDANVELELINVTLDQKVRSRTKELENRNVQLTGYAFINSHLLRAPLARLLGLSSIIRNEVQSLDDVELMDKFLMSCNELDQVVRLLGEFLSEESVLSQNQLEDLQQRIRDIAAEMRAII